jgi:hypothetical protein
MESMRDVNRVIEREIKKGSCPLRFEPKGFGDYKYNEIDSEDKLVDVLSYLLRIGKYEKYGKYQCVYGFEAWETGISSHT